MGLCDSPWEELPSRHAERVKELALVQVLAASHHHHSASLRCQQLLVRSSTILQYIGPIDFALKHDIGPHISSRSILSLRKKQAYHHTFSPHGREMEARRGVPRSPPPKVGGAVNESLSTTSQNLSLVTEHFIDVSFKGKSRILKVPGRWRDRSSSRQEKWISDGLHWYLRSKAINIERRKCLKAKVCRRSVWKQKLERVWKNGKKEVKTCFKWTHIWYE